MGEQTGELEEFKEFEEFGGEESGARIQEPGGASAWRGAAFSGGSPIVLKQAAPENVCWSATSQGIRREVFSG